MGARIQALWNGDLKCWRYYHLIGYHSFLLEPWQCCNLFYWDDTKKVLMLIEKHKEIHPDVSGFKIVTLPDDVVIPSLSSGFLRPVVK